jgi:heme/copper-type cytochrome/quinol oxidase subunit 3
VALYVTALTLSVLVAVAAGIVGAGIVYLVATMLSGTGVYTAHENNEVEIAALYWHFVDLIWILVFTFVYLI